MKFYLKNQTSLKKPRLTSDQRVSILLTKLSHQVIVATGQTFLAACFLFHVKMCTGKGILNSEREILGKLSDYPAYNI